MVTAILIPIICVYFYWLTKKEMKEHESKWLALNDIVEEAIIEGKILEIQETKKRFYYHRFILVLEIKLQCDTKNIIVKRVTPLTKQPNPMNAKIDNFVRLYGNWQENEFRFLRYEVID